MVQEDPGDGVGGAGRRGPDPGGVEGFVAQAALMALPEAEHMAGRRSTLKIPVYSDGNAGRIFVGEFSS